MLESRRLPLLWRRLFPSHVSIKESLIFAFSQVGLYVRLRKGNRVRGQNLLDDISVLIPKSSPQVVFDVGAHYGETIFKICNLLRNPVVHSFEPTQAAYDRLYTAFHTWPELHLNRLALGELNQHVSFHEYEYEEGSPANSVLLINRRTANTLRNTKLIQTVTVKMETLDTYCSARSVNYIDWLKIDAQGYDLNVLRGARRLLSEQSIALISMEMNFLPMYEGEGTFCETLAYLRQFGYSLVDLYDKNYVDNRLSCCDLLFARDGRQLSVK